MKVLHYNSTLMFYESVQIFDAFDVIGGNYVCILTHAGESDDDFLAVGISPEDLRRLKLGDLDLRNAIQNRPLKEWFTLKVGPDIAGDLNAIEGSGDIPEDMLPLDGLFLAAPDLSPQLVIEKTKELNNAVLEVCIDPPEAARVSKVHATTLAGMVSLTQTLVKHAYNKALAGLSESSRRGLDVIDGHQIDAIATATGSFRILFEASKGPDLWRFVELQRALVKLDELTSNAESPEKALEIVKANKGHLAGAYMRLLQFLIDTKTEFSYKWSSPETKEVRGRTITQKEAGPLLEIFNATKELGVETVILHGKVREADSINGHWKLQSSEDGKVYSGKVKEGGRGVSHIVIDNIYRFECEEKLEEVVGSGKELRTLLLVDYNEG
jgi:hypothetical protein